VLFWTFFAFSPVFESNRLYFMKLYFNKRNNNNLLV